MLVDFIFTAALTCAQWTRNWSTSANYNKSALRTYLNLNDVIRAWLSIVYILLKYSIIQFDDEILIISIFPFSSSKPSVSFFQFSSCHFPKKYTFFLIWRHIQNLQVWVALKISYSGIKNQMRLEKKNIIWPHSEN